MSNTIDPEHRIEKLESQLESHAESISAFRDRIEAIEVVLEHLTETLENTNTYLQRLSK